MLKGYADEHVVLALVEALRRRGMEIVRVQDRGREKADDADLLDEALAERRIMFTNDTDFLGLAAERAQQQRLFAPIFSGLSNGARSGKLSGVPFVKRPATITSRLVRKSSFSDPGG